MKILANINNSLGYLGEINVSYISNGNVVLTSMKNRGTQHLFDTITKFLAGYDVSDCVPRYIDIRVGNDSVLTSLLDVVSPLWGSSADTRYSPTDGPEAAGYLSLTATLLYTDKNSLTTLSSPSIVLLDKNKKELCIIDEMDNQISNMWSSVNDSTSAVIEWKLSFGNA